MLFFLSGPRAHRQRCRYAPSTHERAKLAPRPGRAARCCTPAAYLAAQHNSEHPSGARSVLSMVRVFLFVCKPRKFFFFFCVCANSVRGNKIIRQGRRNSPYRNSRLSRCPSTCPRTVLSPPEANDPCRGLRAEHTHTQTQLVCFVCCVSDAPLNGCARLFIICNR